VYSEFSPKLLDNRRLSDSLPVFDRDQPSCEGGLSNGGAAVGDTIVNPRPCRRVLCLLAAPSRSRRQFANFVSFHSDLALRSTETVLEGAVQEQLASRRTYLWKARC